MAMSTDEVDKYIKDINKARVQLGMLPVVTKPRKCLRCEKVFTSVGVNQRLCANCKVPE